MSVPVVARSPRREVVWEFINERGTSSVISSGPEEIRALADTLADRRRVEKMKLRVGITQ